MSEVEQPEDSDRWEQRQEWLAHPETKFLRKEMAGKEALLIEQLVRAAESSTDPGCRAAVVRLQSLRQLITTFERDKETDDDPR